MSGGVVACIAAILSIGGSGMIAQTVMLRELLCQFAGSELHVGIIIGNWIAAEALGTFAAGRFMKDSPLALTRYIRLTILLSLLFPVMLFLARTWRVAAHLPSHETVSLGQLLSASIILLFPLAIIQGAQFILAISIYARVTGRAVDSPGKVYGVETVGTVIGGSAASFLLIPMLTLFQIAALMLLVNGVICFYLQKSTRKVKTRPELLMLLTPLLAAAVLALGGAALLESSSLKLQWSGDILVAAKNTPYQNIAVIRSNEQYTFYGNGVPLVSLPDPDIAAVEESTHLPLLAHPHPGRVLLLGNGAGGVIGEILKHPSVARIDYLELDQILVQTIEKYAPESTLKALHDPRVHIRNKDGRAFLRDAEGRYDLVLIAMPLPLNLQGNRYFTSEFFREVKRVLVPEGIVSLGATGSMSYYGDDLKAVTKSLVRTLRDIFPHLLVVPGDRNLFVASSGIAVEALTAGELSGRLEARGVKAALISGPHLQWLLSSTPRQWFQQNVGEGGVVNSDFSPYLLTRHLSYLAARLNLELKPVLALLDRVKTAHAASLILLLTLLVAILSRSRARVAIIWTMATTGFAAMLLELAFFFVFQLFQGVMLQTIGLLIAIFMAGLWGGSRLTSRSPAAASHDLQRLFAGEAGLLFLTGTLWLISSGVLLSASSSTATIYLTILPLIFLAGFAAGMQFPPATRLTADASGPGSSLVYGFDLLGGWLGGLVGGALLLPLLGFSGTAALLLLLKGGSIVCLYLYARIDKI